MDWAIFLSVNCPEIPNSSPSHLFSHGGWAVVVTFKKILTVHFSVDLLIASLKGSSYIFSTDGGIFLVYSRFNELHSMNYDL